MGVIHERDSFIGMKDLPAVERPPEDYHEGLPTWMTNQDQLKGILMKREVLRRGWDMSSSLKGLDLSTLQIKSEVLKVDIRVKNELFQPPPSGYFWHHPYSSLV